MQDGLGALLRRIDHHDVSEVGGQREFSYTKAVGFDGMSTSKICNQKLTMMPNCAQIYQ